MSWKNLLCVVALGAAPLVSGCVAAAGAAAGTAGVMAYENRGAESYVSQSVATTATAARTALTASGVTLDAGKTEVEGDKIELKGKSGSQDVNVDIEANKDAGQTHIYVSVKKNQVDYDKSRADELLRAILAQLKK